LYIPACVNLQSTGLAFATTLHILQLDHCGIGDGGCVALGAAVPRARCIQTLSLSHNIFSTVGAMAMLELTKHSRIKRLALHNNTLIPQHMCRTLWDQCTKKGVVLSVDGIDPTVN